MSEEHVLAGYRVASRAIRRNWQDWGLLGPELISMSDCVADVMRAQPDDWDEWFDDVDSAGQAKAGRSDLHVLAVGIAAADAALLIKDIGAPRLLSTPEPFPAKNTVLGHELVGFDTGGWHTWTCLGGLVDDVRRATGVRPGPWGLIHDEWEARRAAEWLTASALGDPKVFFWVSAKLAEVTFS
ncbi:hypothetical protein [Amycolatopsis sp.]|uniref:hypothetical protein n=1 Tax=Amycolatopsis sp. TaxID=37632 RepID=UPI002E08AF68|nr:hypothetical protein [Amycolatopsis sp.]